MLQILLALLLVPITYWVYKWVVKPLKEKKRYAKLFRSHGYKVLELPFKPIGAPYFEILAKSEIEHKDTLYHHKHTYQQYDIIVSNVLDRAEIIVLNMDLIKDALTPDKLNVFHKHNGPYETTLDILREGIVVVEGNQWKKRRKLLSKIFNFDFISAQIPHMLTIADRSFDKMEQKYWEKHGEVREQGIAEFEIYDLMIEFSSSTVMAGFLGMGSLKQKWEGKTISDLVLDLTVKATQALKDPLIILFGSKFLNRKLRQKDREFVSLSQSINSILNGYIRKEDQRVQKEIQTGSTKQDYNLLELLLVERNKSMSTDQPIYGKISELVDEVKTFIIAGSETTSNLFTGMILHMFKRPDVVERLRKEIDSVIKSDQDITVQNFKKIPFLDCVIYEACRVFFSSYGPFERDVVSDTAIGDVPLNKGVCLMLVWIKTFYSAELFEDPLEFRPERWEKEENRGKISTVSSNFSGGPRGCLGKNLAITEMKVMMIKFLQRYENLVELKERMYELQLTYHIKHSDVKVTKKAK